MKALLGDILLARADRDEPIQIEGNWYVPPAGVRFEQLAESPTPYTCPWKGECQYLTVRDGDTEMPDRGWSYPHPQSTAIDRDFSGYVASWKEIQIVEEEGSADRLGDSL